MKTAEEIERIIDYKIIVDCYNDDEVNMGWFYYMEENLEFPFDAQLQIKKRDGSKELKRVEVIGLSTTDTNFIWNFWKEN